MQIRPANHVGHNQSLNSRLPSSILPGWRGEMHDTFRSTLERRATPMFSQRMKASFHKLSPLLLLLFCLVCLLCPVAEGAVGTVIAWGDNSSGQTNVPPGLTNVIAVAAGEFFT